MKLLTIHANLAIKGVLSFLACVAIPFVWDRPLMADPTKTQANWPVGQSSGRKHKPSSLVVNNLHGAQGKVVLEVLPGQQKDLEELGGETRPAKVCIAGLGSKSCYIAQARRINFARDAQAYTVDLGEGHSAVLFHGRYVGLNDEWELVAILGLGSRGQLNNLLPTVVISMQDHFRVWRDSKISDGELITAAQYVWTSKPPKETHFSSHHYQVSTYKFCPSSGRYLLVDQFLTRRKFPGLDGENHPGERVLSAMLPQAQSRLLEDRDSRKHACKKLDEK